MSSLDLKQESKIHDFFLGEIDCDDPNMDISIFLSKFQHVPPSFASKQIQRWLKLMSNRRLVITEVDPYPNFETLISLVGEEQIGQFIFYSSTVGENEPCRWMRPNEEGRRYLHCQFVTDHGIIDFKTRCIGYSERDWYEISETFVIPILKRKLTDRISITVREFTGYATGHIDPFETDRLRNPDVILMDRLAEVLQTILQDHSVIDRMEERHKAYF